VGKTEPALKLKMQDKQEGNPLPEVVRGALAQMESAGFKERKKNLALLAAHDNDVEAAINELLDGTNYIPELLDDSPVARTSQNPTPSRREGSILRSP
jgi:uncharacterized UBP type Zn finger protein